MSGERWNVGEPRLLSLEFRNAGGTYTDPTTITVSVSLPDRTVVDISAAVVKTDIGRYVVGYTAAQVGEHVFRVVSTGPVSTVTEQVLYAVPPYEVIESHTHARADAARHLSRMCAAAEAPTLSDDEIDSLVTFAARRDGTFNLRRAAAEGWRWKAAQVAGAFSFSADGVAVDKTMVVKHCLLMAQQYDGQASRTSGVRSLKVVPHS